MTDTPSVPEDAVSDALGAWRESYGKPTRDMMTAALAAAQPALTRAAVEQAREEGRRQLRVAEDLKPELDRIRAEHGERIAIAIETMEPPSWSWIREKPEALDGYNGARATAARIARAGGDPTGKAGTTR